MNFVQPFCGFLYRKAGILGNADATDIVLIAFQKIDKHIHGWLELLISIYQLRQYVFILFSDQRKTIVSHPHPHYPYDPKNGPFQLLL